MSPGSEYFCVIIFKINSLLVGYTWKKTSIRVDFHTRSQEDIWTLILQMVIRCCRVAVFPTPTPIQYYSGLSAVVGERLGLPSIFNTAPCSSYQASRNLQDLPGLQCTLHSKVQTNCHHTLRMNTLKTNKHGLKIDVFVSGVLNFVKPMFHLSFPA